MLSAFDEMILLRDRVFVTILHSKIGECTHEDNVCEELFDSTKTKLEINLNVLELKSDRSKQTLQWTISVHNYFRIFFHVADGHEQCVCAFILNMAHWHIRRIAART